MEVALSCEHKGSDPRSRIQPLPGMKLRGAENGINGICSSLAGGWRPQHQEDEEQSLPREGCGEGVLNAVMP